jgi:hypothetical protein
MIEVKELIGEVITNIQELEDGDIIIETNNYKIKIIDPIYPGESFKFEIDNFLTKRGINV